MTQLKYKVKRGDTVQIMTGSHKGKTGLVKKVLLEDGKVIVEGVNVVVRHKKPDQTHPDGKVEKTLPIQISNVAVVDPNTGDTSKIGYRMENGKKVRFFKKSGDTVQVTR